MDCFLILSKRSIICLVTLFNIDIIGITNASSYTCLLRYNVLCEFLVMNIRFMKLESAANAVYIEAETCKLLLS